MKVSAFADEVVVVDGRSTDHTLEVVKEHLPDASIVIQDRQGKGNALRCGYKHATGDIVVQMDADGSMDLNDVAKMVEELQNGYDISKGSRFLPGGGSADMTILRRFGALLFAKLTTILFLGEFTDICYGFMAFKKDALSKLIKTLATDGFEIETEICIKAQKLGLKVVEVPSYEYKRRSGNSNLRTFRDGWRILNIILKEFLRFNDL
jgi:glycosyltransferase involved in cell wall biosynthesis